MTVELLDDKKGRHQSFEAKLFINEVDGMGSRDLWLNGYGSTESEAKENLLLQAEKLTKEMQAIFASVTEFKSTKL